MIRRLFWTGVALLVIGTCVFAVFVLPHIPGREAGTAANGQGSDNPPILAVLGSGIGLAAGCGLVGIGLGRWKRPKSSRADGSPEV